MILIFFFDFLNNICDSGGIISEEWFSSNVLHTRRWLYDRFSGEISLRKNCQVVNFS